MVCFPHSPRPVPPLWNSGQRVLLRGYSEPRTTHSSNAGFSSETQLSLFQREKNPSMCYSTPPVRHFPCPKPGKSVYNLRIPSVFIRTESICLRTHDPPPRKRTFPPGVSTTGGNTTKTV